MWKNEKNAAVLSIRTPSICTVWYCLSAQNKRSPNIWPRKKVTLIFLFQIIYCSYCSDRKNIICLRQAESRNKIYPGIYLNIIENSITCISMLFTVSPKLYFRKLFEIKFTNKFKIVLLFYLETKKIKLNLFDPVFKKNII